MRDITFADKRAYATLRELIFKRESLPRRRYSGLPSLEL